MNDTYQDRAEAYADAWFNWDNCESEAQASHTHGLTQNPTQTSPLKQLHKNKQTPSKTQPPDNYTNPRNNNKLCSL